MKIFSTTSSKVGHLCFSEKVLSISGKIQTMMEFLYYDYKRQNFTEKQILDKETELRHLAKLTNEDLLIKQLLGIGFSVHPNHFGETTISLDTLH